MVESVWNFQADKLKLVTLEKYHPEYIVILPSKEQMEMVDTSVNL